jgi:Fic family protein
MELNNRHRSIIRVLVDAPGIGISRIRELLGTGISIPTLNRDLKYLVDQKALIPLGRGRNRAYKVSEQSKLLDASIGDSYFQKDADERSGNNKFDPALLELLDTTELFTVEEKTELQGLQHRYTEKIATITEVLRRKEMERLTIELSWKSSQIEGNTYSLLETEQLLKDKQLAENKKPEEADMLLNHKTAMEYLAEGRVSVDPITLRSIEDIHTLLTNALGIERNLRKRVVRITGTTYQPPDNEYQIREYLERACEIINKKEFVYEKSMLAVLLISLLQPFEDGNKRTARITANGILMENGYCPLSYRGIKPIDYKKAMILFYEQGNITMFRDLFIEQAVFAVENYF